MQNMTNIVISLQNLIDVFGLDKVRYALNYIENFPVTRQYLFKNFTGADWYLSDEEYQRVNEAYANGYGKIQAIKVFRDITSCGLKEAKDAVESYFEHKTSV